MRASLIRRALRRSFGWMRKLLADRRGSGDLTTHLLLTAAGAAMVGVTLPSLFASSNSAANTFNGQVKVLEQGAGSGGGSGGPGGIGGSGWNINVGIGKGGVSVGVGNGGVGVGVGNGGVGVGSGSSGVNWGNTGVSGGTTSIGGPGAGGSLTGGGGGSPGGGGAPGGGGGSGGGGGGGNKTSTPLTNGGQQGLDPGQQARSLQNAGLGN